MMIHALTTMNYLSPANPHHHALYHFQEQLNTLFPLSDVKKSSYLHDIHAMEEVLLHMQNSQTEEEVYRECCQLYYLRLGCIDSKEFRRSMRIHRVDPINVENITQLQPAPFRNTPLERQVLALKEQVESSFSLNIFKQGYAYEMLDVERHLEWMLSNFPHNEYLISCRLYYLRMGHVKSLKYRCDNFIDRVDPDDVEVLRY